jgi:aspartate aminotransferase
MIDTFHARRDLMVGLVRGIRGLECKVPSGAFYVFVKYSADIPSVELAERLLQEAHVAVTPGSAFGPAGEGFFRLSYAASEEQITEGLSRIKKFMESL